jgi:excisionase family DNA binding protein
MINYSFEAMPQNLAAISNQISDINNDISEIKRMMSDAKRPQVTEEFINIDAACEVVHLAKPTLYRMCQQKQVPHYKPAKELLFRKSELIKWVENSRSSGSLTREEMEAELCVGNRRKPKSRF